MPGSKRNAFPVTPLISGGRPPWPGDRPPGRSAAAAIAPGYPAKGAIAFPFPVTRSGLELRPLARERRTS